MANFFSSLMTILMVGLVGVLLFKNIIGLVDIIKNRKLSQKIGDMIDNSVNIESDKNNNKEDD